MPKNVVVQSRISEVVYKNFKRKCRKRKMSMSAVLRELIMMDIKVDINKTYLDNPLLIDIHNDHMRSLTHE